MKNISITDEEAEAIYTGLCMRRAYIETGDALMSAADAVSCGKQNKLKPLSTEQMQLIVMQEGIIKKIFNAKKIICT